MTREEAIKELEFERQGVFKSFFAKEVLGMAISALSADKWIPVSERLPKEEQEVLCQLSDDSMAVLYIQDNWGQMDWVDGMMGTGTYDVVAWRELPEPYKKGE